jgi:hypothetical protein
MALLLLSAFCFSKNWTNDRKLSRMRGEAARKAAIFLGRRSGNSGQKNKRLSFCPVSGVSVSPQS